MADKIHWYLIGGEYLEESFAEEGRHGLGFARSASLCGRGAMPVVTNRRKEVTCASCRAKLGLKAIPKKLTARERLDGIKAVCRKMKAVSEDEDTPDYGSDMDELIEELDIAIYG